MPDAPATIAYRLEGEPAAHLSNDLAPSDPTLYGLHRSVQIAFGWEDYHLHAFKVHGRRYGTQWTGQRHYIDGGARRELALADLSLRQRQKFLYEYDFGDFWEHEIRIEGREGADHEKPYPLCTGGGRARPPEDIGGPEGYDRLLERLEDVRLERLYGTYHSIDLDDGEGSEEDEWALAARNGFDGFEDPSCDPSAFDRRAVNAALKREFVPGPGERGADATGQAEAP